MSEATLAMEGEQEWDLSTKVCVQQMNPCWGTQQSPGFLLDSNLFLSSGHVFKCSSHFLQPQNI